ncbi:MAG: DUF2066 domain-containing protein [Gammaproteobacteria bacterium]
MKVLKLGIIILLTLSIDTSARVFDELFIVRVPQDSYENINDGLIIAFNKISLRLTGTKDPSIIKSLNALGLNKTTFVKSYRVLELQENVLLEVIFNKDSLIQLFRSNNIPIYGVNRPELTIIAKIDDGLNKVFYLNEDRNIRYSEAIDTFISNLGLLSRERGLHIDLPSADLRLSESVGSKSYFDNLQASVRNNYSYSFVRELEVFRDSISTWALRIATQSYRFNSLDELLKFALSYIEKDVDDLLRMDIQESSQGPITVNAVNIKSFEDFKNFKSALEEIFSISNIQLLKASKERFLFNGYVGSSINQIKKELFAHTDLQMISFDEDNRIVNLRLIK